MKTNSWDQLKREARAIERTLETKLPELSVINSSLTSRDRTDPGILFVTLAMCVLIWVLVENPPEETRQDNELVLGIEKDLSTVGFELDFVLPRLILSSCRKSLIKCVNMWKQRPKQLFCSAIESCISITIRNLNVQWRLFNRRKKALVYLVVQER